MSYTANTMPADALATLLASAFSRPDIVPRNIPSPVSGKKTFVHLDFTDDASAMAFILPWPWCRQEWSHLHWPGLIQTSVHTLDTHISWWRHQMETFPALLTICAGNSPVTGEFPAQRPVTLSFYVFFDLRLNIRLDKHSWGWCFETHWRPLWRHCNVWKRY